MLFRSALNNRIHCRHVVILQPATERVGQQLLRHGVVELSLVVAGESFTNIKELKKILASNHKAEFYHTVTEKLLTYALGRGLEYYDVATVDAIVERLEKSNGRPSELLTGIIESAPFQKTRSAVGVEKRASVGGTGERAARTP